MLKSRMNEFHEETILEVPKKITSEWLKDALETGKVNHEGKVLFVRPFNTETEEANWIEEKYGYRGSDDKVYVYSAAPAELIPDYLKHGLLSSPKSINASSSPSEQVQTAVRGMVSDTGFNAVFVWRTNVANTEYRGGFGENYITPRRQFEGNRDDLPKDIKRHLKENPDLRQLLSNDLIGIYLFDKSEYKRKVDDKALG